MDWKYESKRDSYEFPYCERSPKMLEKPGRPPHIHLHHSIELIYVIEGSMRLELYETDRLVHSVTLSQNDVILVNCNILHDTITLGHVRYYLALIPPNQLMSPLRVEVGMTCTKPFNDSDGRVSRLLGDFSSFAHWRCSEPYKGVLCTALADSVIAYLLPRLRDNMIALRGGSMKSDILTYIYQNYRNPELSAESVARNFGYSKRYLSALFCDMTGCGIRAFLTDLRINDAKNLLSQTEQTIESIAYTVGFESVRTFFRVFRESTGMTPREWRESSSPS